MTRRRAAILAAVGVTLGLLGLGLSAGAASAHDALVGADPAAGSTVSALDAVELSFSSAPLGGDDASIIQVIGPDGRYYETACPSITDTVATGPVELGAAGEYQVRWRVVSSDGHPISDSYTFTYAPGADAAAAQGSEGPRCGEASSPSAPEESGGESGGLLLGVGIGAGVLVVVGIAAWLILRRPRGTREG